MKELVHDGMMEACYEWARGVPFVQICKLCAATCLCQGGEAAADSCLGAGRMCLRARLCAASRGLTV